MSKPDRMATRVVLLALAALVAASPMVDVAIGRIGDPAGGGGVPEALAASTIETVFNPFGDPWANKGASNPSIPIGLTPACHRAGPKAVLPAPTAEEVEFLAKSNHPILFEECAEISEDSPRIRAVGAAIDQANPNVKYVGYLPVTLASTGSLGGPGPYTVALREIDRNHERFFLHRRGSPATRANRLRNFQGHHIYDITNPAFRALMVRRILEALVSHNMDGVVIDSLDFKPLTDLRDVDPTTLSRWLDGSVAFIRLLNQALEPDKLALYTGFSELEAFNRRMLEASDGLIWEDPLGPAVPDGDIERNLTRLDQVYAWARSFGNKYVGAVVNTNVNGTRVTTTNRAREQAFARFYLAAHLISFTGDRTFVLYYTPTITSPQFGSSTFFKDWDLQLGRPLRARETCWSDVSGSVYGRAFQQGQVWLNDSREPYDVVPGKTLVAADGRRVAPGTPYRIPPRSGMVFVDAESGPVPRSLCEQPLPPGPPPQISCQQRLRILISRRNLTPLAAQITVRVEHPRGTAANRLVKLEFGAARSSQIVLDGQGVPLPKTVNMRPNTLSKSFLVRRLRPNTPAAVPFVAYDRCGRQAGVAFR